MSGQVKQSVPVPVPVAGASALSKQQQRLWVLDQVEYTAAAHNIPLCLRLQGKLDRSVLERSFRALVERNAVLGSRFVAMDGEPTCVCPTAADVSLPYVDLTHLQESKRIDAALLSAKEELAQPFDLSKDCLLRATLFSVGAEDHLLAVAAHQIVCDRRSTDVLAAELAAL